MAVSSIECQRGFVLSVPGILKFVEILLGAGCWGIMYFGSVMKTSNDSPQVNDQTLPLTLVTLPVWILTCASFIFFLFMTPTKPVLVLDNVFNAVFAVAYAFTAGMAVSSRNFIWLCISPDGQLAVDAVSCDEPGFSSKLRNDGQNLALGALGLVLAATYFSHWIYVTVSLCMNPVLLYEQPSEFQPVNTN